MTNAHYKPCKACGLIKPHAEFYAAPGNADGLRNTCKACKLHYVHSYRLANLDSVRMKDRLRKRLTYVSNHAEAK